MGGVLVSGLPPSRKSGAGPLGSSRRRPAPVPTDTEQSPVWTRWGEDASPVQSTRERSAWDPRPRSSASMTPSGCRPWSARRSTEGSGDAPRASPDPSVERLADHGRQPLGVIEAEDLGLGSHADRSRVDWTGEASSPHLVQTGDCSVSVGTGAGLLLEEPSGPAPLFLEGGSAETGTPPVPDGQFSLFSAMRAALPLRSRR